MGRQPAACVAVDSRLSQTLRDVHFRLQLMPKIKRNREVSIARARIRTFEFAIAIELQLRRMRTRDETQKRSRCMLSESADMTGGVWCDGSDELESRSANPLQVDRLPKHRPTRPHDGVREGRRRRAERRKETRVSDNNPQTAAARVGW